MDKQPARKRKLKAILAASLGTALLGLAVLPAAADAATAYVHIKRVYFIAGAGETNHLTISLSGADYVLSDSGAAITAGTGCTSSGYKAVCPTADIIGMTVSAKDGDDIVENQTSTPSTLSGGDGNDSLTGGSGNDILRGNQGFDFHAGGAGDDFIDSRGDKADRDSCGAGNDTVEADNADTIFPDCELIDRGVIQPAPTPPSVAEPPTSAKELLGSAEARRLRPGACVKNILGTLANDRLIGTAGGDNLFGLQGNDILAGRQGDDCLFGGLGSDILSGGRGDDRLLGDDSQSGIGGNDRLYGNAGKDLLVGGSGADKLVGGTGKDRLKGNNGNDTLRGGKGKDRLKGGRGQNRLFGGPGADRLDGVNGQVDLLDCGRGRDTVRADRSDHVRGCEHVHRARSGYGDLN